MAKITEEDKRDKLNEEATRLAALQKKKELAAQKQLLKQNIIGKRYDEIKDEFINPKLLDFIDLDDCFQSILRKPPLDAQFGELTEKQRLMIFAQMKEDLKFKALQKNEKFSIDAEAAESSVAIKNLLDDRNAAIQKSFHTHVPVYTLYTCSCCGAPKRIEEFYHSWSFTDSARIDSAGIFHKPICIDCCKKIFEYYYLQVYNKDPIKAMERYCAETDIYWDIDVFESAQKHQLAHNFQRHIVNEYASSLAYKKIYTGYWDSPDRVVKIVSVEPPPQTKAAKIIEAVPQKIEGQDKNLGVKQTEANPWSVTDKKNKNKVLKLFGYDPFNHITDQEELKRVYRDFLNILDDDMEEDLVKLQAAAQIVSSYSRIREIDAEYEHKKAAQAGTKALKDISDLKAKELKAISDFAKDNGFSERWATAKAKGENTFTGILSRMNNSKFENAAINGYDILTSESIQEVADASFKSIFSQLNLGEADVWKTCQSQLEELLKLRAENASLKEGIRKAEYAVTEASLIERAKKEKALEDGENSDYSETGDNPWA